jgi:hypothetical protein
MKMSLKKLDRTHLDPNAPGEVGFHGNPNTWVLLCKAWNKEEEWMKSTSALGVHKGRPFPHLRSRRAYGGCKCQVDAQVIAAKHLY